MNMDQMTLWTIAQRELREALRNKWLWFYSVGLAGLALGLSRVGLASAGYAGLGGFGRTAASLINALLLFVPLIGLTVGANAVAADRERGALMYLLAQPVNRPEVFFGKVLGAMLAVIAALGLGFGLAGLGLASAGDADVTIYLTLAGFVFLLALACLGIGFLISTLTRKASTAAGAALLLWLGLVFFADLGLMGATIAFKPTAGTVLWYLLANPLQTFKLGAMFGLHATLDILGPVGQYAAYHFGDHLPWLLTALLLAWSVSTFGAAFFIFNRRGDV
ncbi:MAG: ABC transporter permease [Anaerolineales bacterium]|nr:ABC transporter permease [Anaerolineales bacterium]